MMVSSLVLPAVPAIMRRAEKRIDPFDKTSQNTSFLALYKTGGLCYSMLTAYPIGSSEEKSRGSYLYPTTLFSAARVPGRAFFAQFRKMTVASGRALRYNKES